MEKLLKADATCNFSHNGVYIEVCVGENPCVLINREVLKLQPGVYKLLAHLAKNADRPCRRTELLCVIERRPGSADRSPNLLDVTMCKLRSALRAEGVEGFIATVPGGYQIVL